MERNLEAAISGSFKFKPEIDELIDEFADYNVTVLEPAKGWLYIPSRRIIEVGFRPLPNERGLDIDQIEGNFLAAVDKSDFLYVNNLESYLGQSMVFEIGYAHGAKKPIFTRRPFTLKNFELEFAPYHYLNDVITVATPAETARIMRERKGETSD